MWLYALGWFVRYAFNDKLSDNAGTALFTILGLLAGITVLGLPIAACIAVICTVFVVAATVGAVAIWPFAYWPRGVRHAKRSHHPETGPP